jgi:hypothetical protein
MTRIEGELVKHSPAHAPLFAPNFLSCGLSDFQWERYRRGPATHAYSWADEVGKDEGECFENGCCERECTQDLQPKR